MSIVSRLLALVVVAILLISSAYAIFYLDIFTDDSDEETDDTSDNNDNGNETKDTEPPTIDDITGDTTGTTGKTTTLFVSFSDNENVTEAKLFYKQASEVSWRETSILSGFVDLEIPSDSDENWYYYITVDDAAGNGPVGDPSTNGSVYYTVDVSFDTSEIDHIVFIEDAASTDCSNCPVVGTLLYDSFNPEEPEFYYVTMIYDVNAKDHLDNLNVYGFPTTYLDGGYQVVFGSTDFETNFNQNLQKAQARNKPELLLNLESWWDDNSSELHMTVTLNNRETLPYKGILKTYITEINSRWTVYGHPTHYTFLDYGINKDIEVEAQDSDTFTGVWNPNKEGFSDIYAENLYIIAVVSNKTAVEKFSDPPDNEHPFNANYVDATDGTVVVEGGNLPPSVGITNPKPGRLHIFGNELFATFSLKTILIGRTTITAQASDDTNVTKVEFYVDDELVAEFEDEPYEWTWKQLALFKHEIKVIAYDNEGISTTTEMEVSAFIRPSLL